jgi:uncharacterized protein yefI
MNIAIIDVAASEGGALSVLNDFCEYLRLHLPENVQCFVITSTIKIKETNNLHNIIYPYVKKSWLHRLFWEKIELPKLMKKLRINIVFSLQNNAFPAGNYAQIVYLHNALLVEKARCCCDFKLALRFFLLRRIIPKSWKNADKLIVQCNFMKERVGQYYSQNKVEVIPSQVNIPVSYRNTGGIIKGYIYPCSAYPYKNIESIIRAEKKLNRENKVIDILLTISGCENRYAKKMLRMANGVRGIHFIGRQDRDSLFRLYQEYGLVMASKIESYGIPVAEAMQVGTVVTGIVEPYLEERVYGYPRAHIAQEDSQLAEMLKKGLKDKCRPSASFGYKNTWESVLNILIESYSNSHT